MGNFGRELLIIAFEIEGFDLAFRALWMVPILAIFARILLLRNLVQRAAAILSSVAIGWTKRKNSVQRVAICPTSVHRGFWVGGQAKSLLFSLF